MACHVARNDVVMSSLGALVASGVVVVSGLQEFCELIINASFGTQFWQQLPERYLERSCEIMQFVLRHVNELRFNFAHTRPVLVQETDEMEFCQQNFL
jgi:hypothetical protein